MTAINAHFDGSRFVPDEPLPSDLVPGAKVKVTIEAPEESVLDKIAKLATSDDNLPTDFAAQHDHYTKGLPRR